MEARKAKKTRSYGEASKSSRDARSSLSPPAATSRPQLKDRVKSAPLVASTAKIRPDKQSKHASALGRAGSRRTHEIDSPLSTPESSLSPKLRQEEGSLENERALGSVRVYYIPYYLQHHSKTKSCEQTTNSDGMREITLAVVGTQQVGKSSFIQCALDLRKPSSAPFATKKVSLEGVVSVLNLLEIALEDIKVNAEQHLTWPETVGGQIRPAIDGALVLYDVVNPNSLVRIPDVLSKCLSLYCCGVP